MGRILFAIPGDLATLTGGYGYDRRVLGAMRALGLDVVHVPLPASFPEPPEADVARALGAIAEAHRPGDVLLVDGLAYGAMPQRAIRGIAAPIVALCHHPLCLETGLDPSRMLALRESERQALALADHVIATSETTGELLVQEFSLEPRRLTIAAPGTDWARRAPGGGRPPILLAVGSIIPRKAFCLLVEALDGLQHLDWRLRLVGASGRSPPTAAALVEQIAANGLASRVDLLGELSGPDLETAFATSDIFVSPSVFEGYGMALAEAMAHGLPIVMTSAGAASATVPDAVALKVSPLDSIGLREALREIIVDAELRKKLSEESWRAGQVLPRWDDTARKIAATLEAVSLAPRSAP
jgi:glycosyltransferase involved in cell wall biosynthesis